MKRNLFKWTDFRFQRKLRDEHVFVKIYFLFRKKVTKMETISMLRNIYFSEYFCENVFVQTLIFSSLAAGCFTVVGSDFKQNA